MVYPALPPDAYYIHVIFLNDLAVAPPVSWGTVRDSDLISADAKAYALPIVEKYAKIAAGFGITFFLLKSIAR